MSTKGSKREVSVPKPLDDSLDWRAGSQLDSAADNVGGAAFQPVEEPMSKAAKTYRDALIAVRGTADKRFATTDDFMRFIRG